MSREPKIARSTEEILEMIQEAYNNLPEPLGDEAYPLLPPWKFEPDYLMPSLFWKMGGGEDYLDEFCVFFGTLNDSEKEDFMKENPEPVGWANFYVSLMNESLGNTSGERKNESPDA